MISRDYIVKFCSLAFLYFVTGKLGLLMAVPPGYATAVWPPSGFALAGILIFGYRFWPSIWLGSFLVNIGTALDASSFASTVQSVLPVLLIAFGASMQALAGAYLVRRYVGYPTGLEKEKDVFQFLFLGGPVSCLIGSSVGVSTLIATGAIKPVSFLFSWWTWWTGDSMGVFIFAPLMMVFFAQPQEIWAGRRRTVAVPIALAFISIVLLFVFIKNLEERRVLNQFESQSELMTNSLVNHLQRYFDVLYSLQNFFAGSEHVERSEFSDYVKNIFSKYSSFTALEWDPLVTSEQRASFEQSVRAEGYKDFEIKQMGADGRIERASARDIYFPITYVEPLEKNRAVFGFDFMSEQSRSVALQAAWKSGELTITKPIRLIQGPLGIIAFLPIYHNQNSLNTAEERAKSLKGFVVEVLVIQDIIQESLEHFEDKNFILEIKDRDPVHGESVLFRKNLSSIKDSIQDPVLPKEPVLSWRQEIELAGRHWIIQTYPTADYLLVHESWNMWFVFTGGLLFVAFFGGFLLVVTGRETLINRLVMERTEELSQINQKLFLEGARRQKIAESLQERNVEMADARLAALNIAQDAQEARQKAEEAERKMTEAMSVKSQFTSMVSHELRTPLTIIKESVDIVYDQTAGPVNADQKDFLDTAKRNVDRLGRLINDVLDYQKFDAQKMGFEMTIQDLNATVKEVGEGFRRSFQHKNVGLEIQLHEGLPQTGFDKDRVIQVLTNLLNNAMKFTSQGKVFLTTAMEGPDAVRVSVQDQGIGIKKEDLGKLFQAFSQLSTGTGRKTGGTGLGLALCKQIIEHHGGRMGVDSVFGQGSTFYFVLPVVGKGNV